MEALRKAVDLDLLMSLSGLTINAVAVSIMFPIALETGLRLDLLFTLFFVAIALAAFRDLVMWIDNRTGPAIVASGNCQIKGYVKTGLSLALTCTIHTPAFIEIYSQI